MKRGKDRMCVSIGRTCAPPPRTIGEQCDV